jgi:hypothetical protein
VTVALLPIVALLQRGFVWPMHRGFEERGVRQRSRVPVECREAKPNGTSAGTHMWTAPGLQELWQRADRIACDHMSGLLMRSHMTAGQDGFRDGRSKQGRGGFWSAAGSHGVSRVSDRSITPSARLEQAPASARDENRSHAEFVMPGSSRSPPSNSARPGRGCRGGAWDCSVHR